MSENISPSEKLLDTEIEREWVVKDDLTYAERQVEANAAVERLLGPSDFPGLYFGADPVKWPALRRIARPHCAVLWDAAERGLARAFRRARVGVARTTFIQV